jgi:hypothetical protein
MTRFFFNKNRTLSWLRKDEHEPDVQNFITAIRRNFSERVPCSKYDQNHKVQNLGGASFSEFHQNHKAGSIAYFEGKHAGACSRSSSHKQPSYGNDVGHTPMIIISLINVLRRR